MFEYMIMPFQRYAEFSGRSRRLEYWAFVLMNAVIFIVLGGVAVAMGFSFSALSGGDFGGAAFGAGMMAPFAVMGIYTLLAIIPSIAVTVRRLHDRNMSGWWYLGFIVLSALPVIGFVSNVAFLVITFLPGTPGPNRFGEDPKDPTGSQIFA